MSDHRKQTIVKEIHFWKENRLLPKEYCDFLLALYAGEDDDSTERQSSEQNRKRLQTSYVALIPTLFLLPLSFLVIYFTEWNWIMQTGLLSSFVAIAWIHFYWLKYKGSNLYHYPLIVSLLIFLLLSVWFSQQWGENDTYVFAVLLFHLVCWLTVGWYWRLPYLLISGIIGLLSVSVYIVL
ncbi:hypothetical protein EQV77_01775 [Halobacillus fulvus]|nr:hypothetical protein EQV77_01775 [Halobacillus fulvus]